MNSLTGIVPYGVVSGKNLLKLMTYCRTNQIALPAFNCSSSSTINAVMEAARDLNTPVIIQFNNDEATFLAGKGISSERQKAAILGSLSIAQHVHLLAKYYQVSVVLHSDCCSKDSIEWLDGMIEANEVTFKAQNAPLFSSHSLDLSRESADQIIPICRKYFKRLAPMKVWLEIVIGISAGDHDVSLVKKHEQVWKVYEALREIGPMFSIVTSFRGIHCDDKNVNSKDLEEYQSYIKERLVSETDGPSFFAVQVCSDQTSSDKTSLDETSLVKNEVVKINFDDDARWAYWNGVRTFYVENEQFLQGQVGNPDGDDLQNKKFYDSRNWIRAAELALIARARQVLEVAEPKPDEEKETEKTSGEIVIEEVEKSEKSFPEVEVTNCETDQVQPLQEQEVLIKSAPKLESEILPVIVEEVSDFDSDKLPLWCTPVESINSGPVFFNTLQALKLFLETGLKRGFFVRGQKCRGCRRGCLGCGHRRLSRRGLNLIERDKDGGPNLRPKLWTWRSKKEE